MNWIDPKSFLRRLDRGYIQVNDDRLLVAAHDHAGERLIRVGVDFLVRHVGRHKNKISRARLGDKVTVRLAGRDVADGRTGARLVAWP